MRSIIGECVKCLKLEKPKAFEKDPYIIRWITGLSDGTKPNYIKGIEEYLTFLNMTPTEIISKRMHDTVSLDLLKKTFFENNWREYKQYLEDPKRNLRDGAIHNKLKIASSFFSRNGSSLDLHQGDWTPTTKQEPICKFEVTKEDLKRMYGHANLRDKCLLLILAQSGFSETDISELKIEQIKGLYAMAINEHYYFVKPRDKTNHVQATCLSYEFLHDLRELLIEEGNPTQGYIFISQTRQEIELKKGMTEEDKKKAQAEAKEKRINFIDSRRINEIMHNLANDTFGVDSEKAKAFKTKAFRSFFNACLGGVLDKNSEIKDLMMGHSRGGARDNYSFFKETVIEAYSKIFDKYMSINGLQTKQDLANMENKYDKIIGSQAVEIATIKEDHKKDMDELKALVTQLLNHEKDMNFSVLQTPKDKQESKEILDKREQQFKKIDSSYTHPPQKTHFSTESFKIIDKKAQKQTPKGTE